MRDPHERTTLELLVNAILHVQDHKRLIYRWNMAKLHDTYSALSDSQKVRVFFCMDSDFACDRGIEFEKPDERLYYFYWDAEKGEVAAHKGVEG